MIGTIWLARIGKDVDTRMTAQLYFVRKHALPDADARPEVSKWLGICLSLLA
jgi:hypothetical protein